MEHERSFLLCDDAQFCYERLTRLSRSLGKRESLLKLARGRSGLCDAASLKKIVSKILFEVEGEATKAVDRIGETKKENEIEEDKNLEEHKSVQVEQGKVSSII